MAASFFSLKESEFYTGSESFANQIVATPEAFGLTAAQASGYQTMNFEFKSKYLVASSPETRTKGTVAAKNEAMKSLRALASQLSQIIQATAGVTDQEKYDLGLSVRSAPSRKVEPGVPNSMKASLNGNGALMLGWKCNNPRGATGVLYQLWRSVDGGALTYVGGSGNRTFTDTTIPQGACNVAYQIQAVRTNATSDWVEFNVKFAMSGATVVGEIKPVKIAA